MKKIFFLLLLLFPIVTYASDVKLECESAHIGEEFECTIKSSSIINNLKFNLVTNDISCTSNSQICLESSYNNESLNMEGVITKIKFLANNSGTITLDLCTYNSSFSCDTTLKINPISSVSNIKINNKDIGFNSTTFEYNYSIDNLDKSFKISASGDGITLSGVNSENVVKIDYGSTKTITIKGLDNIEYKVNITNTYNYLEPDSVMVNDIKANKTSSGVYKVEVSSDALVANIYAQSDIYKIEGNGEYSLSEGENIFTIILIDDKNISKEYKIYITRKESLNLSSNTYVKSLTINGVNISKIKDTIIMGVKNSEEKLNISAKFKNNNGYIEYDNNFLLQEGVNKTSFKIISGTSLEEYNLIIIKEGIKNIVENNNEEIIKALKTGDVTVKLNENDEKIISKKVLNSLYNNKLTMEVISDNNLILYSITFYGEEFKSYNHDVNFDLSFETKKKALKNDDYFNIRFLNDIVLPSSVLISINMNSEVDDNLYLYRYNGSKKLTLTYENIKLKDYYATFKVNHLGEYVLTNKKINYFNKWYVIIPISIVFLVIIVIAIIKKDYLKTIIRQKLRKR